MWNDFYTFDDNLKYIPESTIKKSGHKKTQESRKKYKLVFDIEGHNLINLVDVT